MKVDPDMLPISTGRWMDVRLDIGCEKQSYALHVDGKTVEDNIQFDEVDLIEIRDTTFIEPGMVGLWTKAYAATAFDDFGIEIERDD